MDGPFEQLYNSAQHQSEQRSGIEDEAQENNDYAQMMAMILQQSNKLEHVKNRISDTTDRDQYMELIKQESSRTNQSNRLTIEVDNQKKSGNIPNTPKTMQNQKKKKAFHRFHKRRHQEIDLDDLSSNRDSHLDSMNRTNTKFHNTAQNIDRAYGVDDSRNSELDASKQSGRSDNSNSIFGPATKLDFARKKSVYRFEPKNLNQPYLTNEHFKDYIMVDIPENICKFTIDSDDSSHRCMSQMSQEVFRQVDEREKHIQNLFEAGDFIGDYLKHKNNDEEIERSSAKSECFGGGSVHDQSQGQINYGDNNYVSNTSYHIPTHKAEGEQRKSYTEEELQEAAHQFGEIYNHSKLIKEDVEQPDDNYKLLSSYIFGEQDKREKMMDQLKEKVTEIEEAEKQQNMDDNIQDEIVQQQQDQNENEDKNDIDQSSIHHEEDTESQQIQVSAHNYFDNSRNQSQVEDNKSTSQQTNQNVQIAQELLKIKQQLKLAYEIIEKEQKVKIQLVVKLKEVTKELNQLQQNQVENEEKQLDQSSTKNEDQLKIRSMVSFGGAKKDEKMFKKETKNQYCQTMKISDNYHDDYFNRKSTYSRRSSYRNYHNNSGLSSQKNSFRTDNPFEVINNNKVFKSQTDSEMREKRQSMRIKYQKIQYIKQSKKHINHPRASMLTSQNTMRKNHYYYDGGQGGMHGNVHYNRKNFHRNSERLQKYYEGQLLNSSRRNTQKDYSAGYSGKLYNSFQIQKDLDEHFHEFKGLNTQRYDHNQTMNLNSSSKYRNRNSFRGLRDNNYQTPRMDKIMKNSNDSYTRNQVKSSESLKIEELANQPIKDEVDEGFKLIIPEENEEFFSQSPHASQRQNTTSNQNSQKQLYKQSFHEKKKSSIAISIAEKSSATSKPISHNNSKAPSFGRKSNRQSVGSKVDISNLPIEFPKNYNIKTDRTSREMNDRDEFFQKQYDEFFDNKKASGQNSKRSHKQSIANQEDVDALKKLKRQEEEFHVQLRMQKEQLYYQFNQRYSNAKKFWKTRFDELLREKKRQLQVMQQFNTQMQTLHTDHQKTKDALKYKENNIEVMSGKLNKQQAMIQSMFNDFKHFSNVPPEPSPRDKIVHTPRDKVQTPRDRVNDSTQYEKQHEIKQKVNNYTIKPNEKKKQEYQHKQQRQIDEHRHSAQPVTKQHLNTQQQKQSTKMKSNRNAQTIKNSPYKRNMSKDKYLMQKSSMQNSFEKQSSQNNDRPENQYAPKSITVHQSSAPRQLAKHTMDIPRKSSNTSLNKQKKKNQSKTQLSQVSQMSQERSPGIRREMNTIQYPNNQYPSSLAVKYNQFSEKIAARSHDKKKEKKDSVSKIKIQKMPTNYDNKGNNMIINPIGVSSPKTLMSHHSSQFVKRDENQRNYLQNVVENQWNQEIQNRNLMMQEKNLQHQITASQTELRKTHQVFSTGKQSSSLSTKEYLRAYILSGDKNNSKPQISSSNDNSFSQADQMYEHRQSKTEVKNRGMDNRIDHLALNFQQVSQESESYYHVVTLPNDKNSMFSDRALNNMDNQMGQFQYKNIRTPVVDSETNYHAKELSQQKIPIKIQSAKMEKPNRDNSKTSRLKVKGNIKEFINKQQINTQNINQLLYQGSNQKQYSNQVLHSETSNHNQTYYAQKHYQPSIRDFNQDGIRLRNAQKQINRTDPSQNTSYDKRYDYERVKSPSWQMQKQTLKTQSPVIAQKQQQLQMATNPYNLTTSIVNKSDKKISTSSQRMLAGRNETGQRSDNSSHHSYVKSKADYLYSGGNSNRQHREQMQQAYQNQQAYYEMQLQKKSDQDLHQKAHHSHML